jgi:[acyl-carrier-protein] S-malonyltransferase
VYAVVFPGQGAQRVGMGMDLCERSPAARQVFEAADDALGLPLSRWIRHGPEAELRRTEVTQPAILAASIAIWRALEPELAGRPAFFAGHSLGEYSALVAAGGLELAEAVRLVRRRGALMQEAVPEGRGAMAAVIGLPEERVREVCAATPGTVSPANLNSPVQTVIAGEAAAVAAAGEALRRAGARRVVPLEVSAPFHCALMAPAMEKLAPELAIAGFRDLRVPVISNVTAAPYRTADEARGLLREQVCAPVRWSESVRALVSLGARLELEVGPGSVLTGLAARIAPELARASVEGADDVAAAVARVREAIA